MIVFFLILSIASLNVVFANEDNFTSNNPTSQENVNLVQNNVAMGTYAPLAESGTIANYIAKKTGYHTVIYNVAGKSMVELWKIQLI